MSSLVGSYGTKSKLVELTVNETNELITKLTPSLNKYVEARCQEHQLSDALDKKMTYEKFVDAVYQKNQLDSLFRSCFQTGSTGYHPDGGN